MRKEEKREEILRAALELIAEQGFHAAPMAAIAAKAGVAAGTIYCHFDSKETLINELHRGLEEKLMHFLQQGYPSSLPLRERFLYLIRALLRYLIDKPLQFRFMEQYFHSPYGVSLRRERLLERSGSRDVLLDLFDQGIERQVFKALPRVVLYSLAFGPLIAVMRDHILGFVTLDEPLIGELTEACWDAIKK